MKKAYIAPLMGKSFDMDIVLLSDSRINSGEGLGPSGYGGVDTGGEKDPSSRFYQGWNAEEEEEF